MPAHILSRRALVRGASLAALAPASLAWAQTPWPQKPIRLVVGFAPGGGTDVIVRAVSQSMSESLGQPVLIDNKPGASGNIASTEVARAVPDGYTFLAGPSSQISTNPALYKMAFNPATDLVTGPALGRFQFYLVTRAGLGVKNIRELVELARANPGKLSYASPGAGTPNHLVTELFLKQAGIKVVQVPYRGAAPVVQALLAGETDFAIDPGVTFPHVRTGKLQMLGITSAKRSPLFPEVPTFIESGFASMDYDAWVGLWAPTGTPADAMQKVSAALARAVKLPGVQERFTGLGAEATHLDAAEFHRIIQRESTAFSALVKELQITVE